jgi:hypothetical protein
MQLKAVTRFGDPVELVADEARAIALGIYFVELRYHGVWVIDQRLGGRSGDVMNEKSDQPSSSGSVQVFELTMDNLEDQDDLNRRLRKPGEAPPDAAATSERTCTSGEGGGC